MKPRNEGDIRTQGGGGVNGETAAALGSSGAVGGPCDVRGMRLEVRER